MNASRRAAKGFTLIEVLIAILIVVAIGGLVAWNVLGKRKEANVGLVQIQMNQIKDALRDFHLVYDRYPSDEEGIKVLWDKTTMQDEQDSAKWRKFIEKPIANDLWGNEWGYRQKSEHGDEETFDLWSYGPDKQEGTDDDLVNWDKNAEEGGSPTGGSPSGGSPSGSGSPTGG